MKTLLFLLLCWGLDLGRVAAQSRAAGPWRVVHQRVRVRLDEAWSSGRWEDDAYEQLQSFNEFSLPSEARATYEKKRLELEEREALVSQDSARAATDWLEAGNTASTTTLPDTTTRLRTQRFLLKAAWNADPESIRLFLACENPLIAPPTRAGIRFAATGATLRLDARQRLLWLAPSAPVVVLRAYRGQRLVFRHEFRAVEPPAPEVKCFLGSKESTSRGPVEEYYRTITFRAVPDVNFADFMPEDARYRVARFSVKPVRKGRDEAPLVINGPQGDLIDVKFKGEDGDQLQLDIQLVQRQNFRRQVLDVPLKKHLVLSGPWY